jgi:hypothetical protein
MVALSSLADKLELYSITNFHGKNAIIDMVKSSRDGQWLHRQGGQEGAPASFALASAHLAFLDPLTHST